jgi:asparagine synthase (glutamine-hydrolysing)
MAHGREVRLPFLNHDLVSFAFSLPSKFKIHHGFTKWLLRKLMSDKLPASVTWKKKKTGFEPPQKEWMQDNNFKEYAFEAKKELVNQGILDKKVLKRKPVAHEAYDKDSTEWRFIVAGARLLKRKRGLNRNSTPFLKSNIL